MGIKARLILVFFVYYTGFTKTKAKISDRRLCADPECSELIGVGKTVLKNHAAESAMLSFTNNREVKIFSKGAGSNPDLWGVMIDGRRGYVNKAHIQEQKVYKKDLKYEMPTEEFVQPPVGIERSDSQPVDILQTKPHLGDHGKQVALSTDDVEYNHIKSSYSNTAGEYMLEASLPVEATPALDSLPANPTQVINSNIEVIDGTTIYLDGESSDIIEESRSQPIEPTMTAGPKPASDVPEIQSSVISPDDQEAYASRVHVDEQKIENLGKGLPVEDNQQQTPTKQEFIGVPEQEITTQPPNQVPSSTGNIEVVPSNILMHAQPEEQIRTEDMKHSEVIVEPTTDKVGVIEENGHIVENEYNEVDINEKEEFFEKHYEDMNEITHNYDDDEEEEDYETEDKDRKEAIQAHINNLKKAYTDQALDDVPVDFKMLEENKEEQLKLTGQQQHEKIIEHVQSQVGDVQSQDKSSPPSEPSPVEGASAIEVTSPSEETSPTDVQTRKRIQPPSDVLPLADVPLSNINSDIPSSNGIPDQNLQSEEILHKEITPLEVATEQPMTTEQTSYHEKTPEEYKLEDPFVTPKDIEEEVIPAEQDHNQYKEIKTDLAGEHHIVNEQANTEEPASEKSGDTEGTISPIANNGEGIIFHAPGDFVDIGAGQQPSLIFQYKEQHPFISQDQIVQNQHQQEYIPQEADYQSQDQSSVLSQQDNNQVMEHIEDGGDIIISTQEEGLVGDGDGLATSTSSFDVIKKSPDDDSKNEESKTVIENTVPNNEGDAAGNKSIEEIIVNVEPEGRMVEVTFHDDNDLVIEESMENITTSTEGDKTGDMEIVDQGLPDPVGGMTVLSNEAVSGQIIPPVNKREEQDDQYVEWFMQFVPSWLHSISHNTTHSTGLGQLSDDRLVLLVIVAFTLLLVYLVNQCIAKASREKPLIAKIAEMDKKLFTANNELLLMKRDIQENGGDTLGNVIPEETAALMQLQLEQLEQTRKDLQHSEGDNHQLVYCLTEEKQSLSQLRELFDQLNQDLEISKMEQTSAVEKAKQAEEMMEEMFQLNTGNNNSESQENLLMMVQQLQKQLDGQKSLLHKYEPRMKKKEKEAKELAKEVKQLKVDTANARLQADKLKNELAEQNLTEEGWIRVADQINEQLEKKKIIIKEKNTEINKFRRMVSDLREEAEEREEQKEVLQETLMELENRQKRKENGEEDGVLEEGEGWDLFGEWNNIDEAKEVAMLKVQARRAVGEKENMEGEMKSINEKLKELELQLSTVKHESELMRKARDQAVKEGEDSNRRLEVLTEFFNKKETELQKQLGLQSAKFGDVSTDAESTSKKLLSVMSELEATRAAFKVVRGELEEQEKSLKAAVAAQEKKAHENWVAARQAERKLTDVQGEMGMLRNKLTTVEAKNTRLEQSKKDLQNTINVIEQTKGETVNGNGTQFPPIDPALPPLPGLDLAPTMPGLVPLTSTLMNPKLMMPLHQSTPLMDTRLPPLGRMSPGPRDRYGHRDSARSPSPSPVYDRGYRRSSPPTYRPLSPSTPRYRNSSPSSRSERRSQRRPSPSWSERTWSPDRDGRMPSPTRSERLYNRSHAESGINILHGGTSSSRDISPDNDRYSSRSNRSDRYERDSRKDGKIRNRRDKHLNEPAPGAIGESL